MVISKASDEVGRGECELSNGMGWDDITSERRRDRLAAPSPNVSIPDD